MTKKTLIILFLVLALSVVALFGFNYNKKNKLAASLTDGTPTPQPVANTSTGTPAPAPVKPVILSDSIFPLSFGSRGKAVKFLQVITGVTPDGIWGKNTDAAIKSKLDKDGTISVMEFIQYSIASSYTANVFPLRTGSTGNYVKALQIIFNEPITGSYTTPLAMAVQKAIGKSEVSQTDFETLVKKLINA